MAARSGKSTHGIEALIGPRDANNLLTFVGLVTDADKGDWSLQRAIIFRAMVRGFMGQNVTLDSSGRVTGLSRDAREVAKEIWDYYQSTKTAYGTAQGEQE